MNILQDVVSEALIVTVDIRQRILLQIKGSWVTTVPFSFAWLAGWEEPYPQRASLHLKLPAIRHQLLLRWSIPKHNRAEQNYGCAVASI
jgi:hypothetical protein